MAGTAALYSTLFPQDQDMSIWIILGWSTTFLSIALGISTILNEIIFHGNILGRMVRIATDNCTKISEGIEIDERNIPDKYEENNSIWFGTFSIVFFCYLWFFIGWFC